MKMNDISILFEGILRVTFRDLNRQDLAQNLEVRLI